MTSSLLSKTTLFSVLALVTLLGAPVQKAQDSGYGPFVVFYRGPVVWHQPDGRTLRGVMRLSVRGDDYFTEYKPNAYKVGADFAFKVPEQPGRRYRYKLSGRIGSDGHGYLRSRGDDPRVSLPQPVLRPGKISIQADVLDTSANAVTGGVLNEDGTQIALRGAYVVSYSYP